jgi:glycosyltransferase involved in cell wall biosynthesis
MKLNWFSPLPPARTGIADYTLGLLPTLSKHADVTLWTNQNEWDPACENHCRVRHFDIKQIEWSDVNGADITYYNIGNNHLFHAAIWQVSRLHPGIVILHDISVHNFFDSLYNGVWRDVPGYLAQMEAHYGVEGRRAAEEFVRSRGASIEVMTERYPLTSLALENCLGAVVHTPAAFDELRKENQYAVIYAPLPAVFGSQPESEHFEAPSAQPPYKLIVFGHLGKNRRLEAVFEALKGFSDRHQFRLDIYGESDDAKGMRQRIRALNLSDIVKLHGYASQEDLDNALTNAHLAINLRYPTMGEASASQLRLWAYSLPSLVTKVGWYASLSDETVAHVRPDYEVEDIQTHLRAFLNNPAKFKQMGKSGFASLQKNHNPEAYVRALLEMADNANQLRLRAVAREMAKRAGTLMAPWAINSTTDSQRVAKQIHALTAD